MTFLRRAKFWSFDFSLNFSQEITRGGVSFKEKIKPEKGKTWILGMIDWLQDDGDHRQPSRTSQQHWGGRREDSKRDVTKKIKLIGCWMHLEYVDGEERTSMLVSMHSRIMRLNMRSTCSEKCFDIEELCINASNEYFL